MRYRVVYCTLDTTVSSSPASKGRSSGSCFWVMWEIWPIFLQTTKFFSDSKDFEQTHIALEVKLGNVALSASVDRADQGNWVEVVDLQKSSCNFVMIVISLSISSQWSSSLENISKVVNKGAPYKSWPAQEGQRRSGLLNNVNMEDTWNAAEKIRNANMKCWYEHGRHLLMI